MFAFVAPVEDKRIRGSRAGPDARGRARRLVVTGGILAFASSAAGQGPRVLSPGLTLRHSFTHVTAIRELSDGSTLVADAGDHQLYAVRWKDGEVTTVGRTGNGPGEYRSLSELVPLCDDSTLVPDGSLRRILVMSGTRIVATGPANEPFLREFGMSFSGSDTHCSVLRVVGSSRRFGPAPSIADSALAIVRSRSSSRVDTVARLRGGGARPQMIGNGEGSGTRRVEIAFNPLRVAEQALLFPDGWIALARLHPYRVDWRSPDGRVTSGRTLVQDTVPIDEHTKRRAIKELLGPAGASVPTSAFKDWPSSLPAFDRASLFAAPDGSLLIHRLVPSASHNNMYDVVDRKGVRLTNLVLASDSRIVGTGLRTVYTIAVDRDGLEHLNRHAWPPVLQSDSSGRTPFAKRKR